MPQPDNSLTGLRVLDLAEEAGALVGRVLADLGAEVILVEPASGNRVRHAPPFVDDIPGLDRSYRHLYANANKESVVLDITDPDNAGQFRALVASADVLIDTAPVQQLDSLGFGHQALRALQPGLIQASILPYAAGTEFSHWRATDLTASAAGGLLAITGEADGPPCHDANEAVYSLASLSAVAAITIALHQMDPAKPRTGSHIQVSLQECAAHACSQTANINAYRRLQQVPQRPGISQAIRCADGLYVTLLASPMHIDKLITLLDDTQVEHQLTNDNHLEFFQVPIWQLTQSPIHQLISQAAARYPRDEFLLRFAATGCHAMPILNFADIQATEHYQITRPFLRYEHEQLDATFELPCSPVAALRPAAPLRRAPLLGEHSSAVLQALKPASLELTGKATQSRTSNPTPTNTQPLRGLKVLDFTWVIAGPMTTRLLASFGAEVIKVESQQRIDSLRLMRLESGAYDFDLGEMFNIANTGKKSITANLSTSGGREVVSKLLSWADVVVNNFSAGAFARMGFDYDSLKSLRNDVILLHLPGIGGTGPWAHKGTFGPMLSALTGMNHLVGFADTAPRGIGVALPDFTSPMLAAATILTALRHRRLTGEGQEIEFSQLDATLALVGAQWMQYSHSQQLPQRPGNAHPQYAPHGVFPTAGEDRWCAIAIANDAEFVQLAATMKQPHLARDQRFASARARQRNAHILADIITAWTRGQNRTQLAQQLQQRGIAAAAVADVVDVLDANGPLSTWIKPVVQPSHPELELLAQHEPITVDGLRPTLQRAPMLGEHNLQILSGILGYTDADIAALFAADALH